MTRGTLPYAVLVVAVVALGIAYGVRSCAPSSPGEKIPAHTARTIDSLDRTRAGFDSSQAARHAVIVHDTIESVRFQLAAARALRDADRARSAADSLARVARSATDSTEAWRRAYDARTSEALSLRETIRDDSLTLAHERSARSALASAYAADTMRRRAIERVNDDLRAAVARLDVPCRIVGPVRCPSRLTSALGGAILGAIGAHAVGR